MKINTEIERGGFGKPPSSLRVNIAIDNQGSYNEKVTQGLISTVMNEARKTATALIKENG
jgi:ribosomal protein L31E